MEQARVSARACVPELLPVPSQGVKLDVSRRQRPAQRPPSSAAASPRRAVNRSSAVALLFGPSTRGKKAHSYLKGFPWWPHSRSLPACLLRRRRRNGEGCLCCCSSAVTSKPRVDVQSRTRPSLPSENYDYARLPLTAHIRSCASLASLSLSSSSVA